MLRKTYIAYVAFISIVNNAPFLQKRVNCHFELYSAVSFLQNWDDMMVVIRQYVSEMLF